MINATTLKCDIDKAFNEIKRAINDGSFGISMKKVNGEYQYLDEEFKDIKDHNISDIIKRMLNDKSNIIINLNEVEKLSNIKDILTGFQNMNDSIIRGNSWSFANENMIGKHPLAPERI